MRLKQFLYTTILMLVLFCCEYSSEGDLIEQTEPTEIITYNTHVASIIDNNCVNCHSNPAVAGASVPMTNYEEVKFVFENTDALNRMSRQPGETGFMPKYGARLPQASIDLVEQWINEGFLE